MKLKPVVNSNVISEDILINIDSMGGVFDIKEVILKLKTTEDKIIEDINKGTLLAFEKDGIIKIPSFQIKNFQKMRYLETLLQNIKEKTFEEKINFLTSPQKQLSERTPFYVLKKSKSEKEIEKLLIISK